MTAKRIDSRKAARLYLREGRSFKDAIVQSGGSEKQAQKGPKALLSERSGLRREFQKEKVRQLRKLETLGASFSSEQKMQIVNGGLLDSIVKETGAPRVRSIELLGKLKDVGAFTPDTQIGIFSLQVPPEWSERYITTPETQSALAQDTSKVLPAKFVHAALESGKVEVPSKLPTADEPLPVAVAEPPAIDNFSEDNFEILK